MDLGLKDRVAVVTGGAVGIGAAIAEALIREGCRVWIADRDALQGEQTAAAIGAAGVQAMDVTRASDVEQAIDAIVAAERRLDVLVNNAGILKSKAFTDSSAEDWDSVVAVNLSGMMYCIRAASHQMFRQGSGRIVNIASISAERGGGSIGNVLYGTSKAGVVALTKGLAREFGPSGVTVNAVAPAVAETPMTRANLTGDARERIVSRIPLRRLAEPSDIANAVTFLASDRASFITGAILPVDGGILTT